MFKFGTAFGLFVLCFFKQAFSQTTCANNISIPHATVSYSSVGSTSSAGGSCTVKCDPGYVFQSNANVSSANLACIPPQWRNLNGIACIANQTTATTVATTVATNPAQAAENVSTTVSAEATIVTCDTLACKNNGTCVDGTETTPNAMCSCLSGFTGLQCELMGTHSVDLDYLRSLSQKAYYTQKYWVDWSQYSINGDQLKIAMSCSVAALGAIMTGVSYYISKSLMTAPAPPSF